jgi:hypothetical protein
MQILKENRIYTADHQGKTEFTMQILKGKQGLPTIRQEKHALQGLPFAISRKSGFTMEILKEKLGLQCWSVGENKACQTDFL